MYMITTQPNENFYHTNNDSSPVRVEVPQNYVNLLQISICSCVFIAAIVWNFHKIRKIYEKNKTRIRNALRKFKLHIRTPI